MNNIKNNINKYDYSIIKIPNVNFNDKNKPKIYLLLDELYILYQNETKYKNTNKSKYNETEFLIKQKIRELYNYIYERPIAIIENYLVFTPFIYSIYCNRTIMKILYDIFVSLSKEIQQNFLIKPWDYTGTYKFSPLHFAILSNKKVFLHYLLKINTKVNEGDINGNTPLHLACILKRTDMINLMLYYKNVDINLLNIFGESPLYICVKANSSNIVKILLENRANTSYRFENKIIDFNLMISKDDKLPVGKRKIFDDIKGFFIQREISDKRKIEISKKREKQSNIKKQLLKQHSMLCSKMDNIIDINLLYNLASYVGIQQPSSFNRDELCKKIANKMVTKSYLK